MRRTHSYLLLAVAVLTAFLFIYSFYGASVFPRAFVQNYNDQLAAALNFDTSIQFRYGTPIEVARVVDGDTVQLVNGEYVRYNGIDTPEEVDPRKHEQCFAKEAAARNQALVGGQHITVFQDISEKDKYGRWIGLVYLDDGTFVNDILVKEGYAFAYPYPPDTKKEDVFANDEAIAKELMLGLWANCKVTTLSTGRKQTNDIR